MCLSDTVDFISSKRDNMRGIVTINIFRQSWCFWIDVCDIWFLDMITSYLMVIVRKLMNNTVSKNSSLGELWMSFWQNPCSDISAMEQWVEANVLLLWFYIGLHQYDQYQTQKLNCNISFFHCHFWFDICIKCLIMSLYIFQVTKIRVSIEIFLCFATYLCFFLFLSSNRF